MTESCLSLRCADDMLHPALNCKCVCDTVDRFYLNPWSFVCTNCYHIHKGVC